MERAQPVRTLPRIVGPDNVDALRASVLALTLLATGCGSDSPTEPTSRLSFVPSPRTVALVGAGDIGQCGSPGAAATGRLIESIPGEVFLAGDVAYPAGRAADFRDCFDPYWGHARARWHATPGNHEYESAGAQPYFDYFGLAAGPPGLGYHRFIAGEWLVMMLNSEIPSGVGSPQYEYVRQLLESRSFRCQIAIWHRPLFSSGPNGPNLVMRDLWQLLDSHEVEVVVAAHEHHYERFARQDADGRPNETGIRQFTVGTGGAELYQFVRQSPGSEARLSEFGVVRFTLAPTSYDWQFLRVGGGVGDSGFSPCH
jgi:acid phosphatase type 7